MSSKTNDKCWREDERGTRLPVTRSVASLSGKLAMYLSTLIGRKPGKGR